VPFHQRRILCPCFHLQIYLVIMTLPSSTKALPGATAHYLSAGSESVTPLSSLPSLTLTLRPITPIHVSVSPTRKHMSARLDKLQRCPSPLSTWIHVPRNARGEDSPLIKWKSKSRRRRARAACAQGRWRAISESTHFSPSSRPQQARKLSPSTTRWPLANASEYRHRIVCQVLA
jgi:hypothetical protein